MNVSSGTTTGLGGAVDTAVQSGARKLVQDRLRIAVLADRYPTRFNIPKPSRHEIRPCRFLPLNRISSRVQGITLLAPGRYDLLHSMNRIPLASRTRFVISFESHLPIYFGGERSRLFA